MAFIVSEQRVNVFLQKRKETQNTGDIPPGALLLILKIRVSKTDHQKTV
jgi:hypothetical protein